MQRYGDADGTKSDGDIAYRFLITILELLLSGKPFPHIKVKG